MPKQDASEDLQVISATAVTTVLSVIPAAPDYHLIVIHPFGDYKKGHHINDGATISAVMAGENARNCNKVWPR